MCLGRLCVCVCCQHMWWVRILAEHVCAMLRVCDVRCAQIHELRIAYSIHEKETIIAFYVRRRQQQQHRASADKVGQRTASTRTRRSEYSAARGGGGRQTLSAIYIYYILWTTICWHCTPKKYCSCAHMMVAQNTNKKQFSAAAVLSYNPITHNLRMHFWPKRRVWGGRSEITHIARRLDGNDFVYYRINICMCWTYCCVVAFMHSWRLARLFDLWNTYI